MKIIKRSEGLIIKTYNEILKDISVFCTTNLSIAIKEDDIIKDKIRNDVDFIYFNIYIEDNYGIILSESNFGDLKKISLKRMIEGIINCINKERLLNEKNN